MLAHSASQGLCSCLDSSLVSLIPAEAPGSVEYHYLPTGCGSFITLELPPTLLDIAFYD
jgi:hypothetical protein